jgi:MFS-type transporter involved in bile tolerance (Atg22 family)
MGEFMILIFELLFIALLQVILSAILDESGQKQTMKVINIACVIISYFLLFRYVYNQFMGEITAFVNYYF